MNYALARIEELRQKKNIKVNHLCKVTGVPQSTYTTWVAKDRTPQSKHLKPIAEYFNKPISYFYDAEIKKPADDSELSEAKRELISFVNTLQEDAAESMLRMMKVYYEEWQRNQQ